MALIIKNEEISPGIFQLDISGRYTGDAGQFYMLKASSTMDPFLPRPISINDIHENQITFLYQRKGRGTSCIADMKAGMQIDLTGPFGNGFQFFDSDMIFVGGGIGIAPLYYAVKCFNKIYPHRRTIVYLGFQQSSFYAGKFQNIADLIKINIGGKVTDEVRLDLTKEMITCGPEPMMKALHDRVSKNSIRLQVSLESRMACAVGACLGCAVETKSGMQRVCKDGPVFISEEVFYE
ncbi:MAG: dihydroorotate dehydrogenase electron transfer subunit [Anaerofustis sp.]